MIFLLIFFFAKFEYSNATIYNNFDNPYVRQKEKFKLNENDYLYRYDLMKSSIEGKEDHSKAEAQETKIGSKIELASENRLDGITEKSFFQRAKDAIVSEFKSLPLPYSIQGPYYGIRFNLGLNTNTNVLGYETISGQSNTTLFNAKAKYNFMPGISIVAGNTLYSFYRYEFELMYTDFSASTVSMENKLSGSDINFNKSHLRASIFSLYVNNFIEFNPVVDFVRMFVGIGIGAGYYIAGTAFLSNNFFFPSFQGFVGMHFMVQEKIKVGIFWRIQAHNLSIGQKKPFEDNAGTLQDNRPISNGGVKMNNIFVNSLGFEILFY